MFQTRVARTAGVRSRKLLNGVDAKIGEDDVYTAGAVLVNPPNRAKGIELPRAVKRTRRRNPSKRFKKAICCGSGQGAEG